MFNIILGIYIIVAIFVIGGGTFYFFSSSQLLTALLFFVGTLVSFIIFGKKWFDSSNSIFSKTPVSWPPTINSCPDYLVSYKRTLQDGSIEETCIDLVGVSKNGALKIFNKSGNDDNQFFSLKTNSTDSNARMNELCQRAIQNGLTWEGITNGESCTIAEPKPSSSSSSSSVVSSKSTCS